MKSIDEINNSGNTGFRITDVLYVTNSPDVCRNWYPEILFIYPVERNIYGANNQVDFSYNVDKNGQW